MKIKVASPDLGEEEVQAVREVLLSGNLVSGNKVSEFERAFAEYVGTKHAVAVNNGTAALYLALQAMGVGRGDTVIVPPITFFATIEALLFVGALPLFVDVNEDDLTLNPNSVKRGISKEIAAVIPVHLFGAVADCGIKDVFVLEDCAQAHGSANRYSEKAGSLGHAGAFSFFATKHMTTGGEGGMVTTHSDFIADRIRTLRSHGMTDRHTHAVTGYNNRMMEIQAAIGMVQLRKLTAMNAKRIYNSEALYDSLKDKFHFFISERKMTHTYFWLPIYADDRLKAYLTDNGIEFRHRYTAPLYRQPALEKYVVRECGCPVAEKYAGHVIGLPNHHQLTDDEMDYLVTTLRRYK